MEEYFQKMLELSEGTDVGDHRFWVVQYSQTPGKCMFRVFTKWGSLLTSMQRKHSCWTIPFRVFYVNRVGGIVRDVSFQAIMTASEYTPTEEEMEAEEPNLLPQHSQ
jgi:hypothetical protein